MADDELDVVLEVGFDLPAVARAAGWVKTLKIL